MSSRGSWRGQMSASWNHGGISRCVYVWPSLYAPGSSRDDFTYTGRKPYCRPVSVAIELTRSRAASLRRPSSAFTISAKFFPKQQLASRSRSPAGRASSSWLTPRTWSSTREDGQRCVSPTFRSTPFLRSTFALNGSHVLPVYRSWPLLR